eukprot:4873943-Ditylum_brightwellii.AAC.1
MDKGVEEMEVERFIKGAPVLELMCTREGDDILVGLVKEGGGAPEIMEENRTNEGIHSIFIGGNMMACVLVYILIGYGCQ